MQPPQPAQSKDQLWVIGVTGQRLGKQLCGAGKIRFRRDANASNQVGSAIADEFGQSGRQPDPRIDGLRVQLECSLEMNFRVSQSFVGSEPVQGGPSSHHEIRRLGIHRLFPFETPGGNIHHRQVQGARQAGDDLVNRRRKITAVDDKSVGPDERAISASVNWTLTPILVPSRRTPPSST